MPFVEVLRCNPRLDLALEKDLLHPATVDEVIDIGRPPGRRHGVVDVGNGNLQGTRLFLIDRHLVLRLVGKTVRAHQHQFGFLGGHLQELVACFHQRFVADTAVILQEKVETRGVAEFGNRRRYDGDDHRIPDRGKTSERAIRECVDGLFRTLAILERLEVDESHPRILSASGKVEAIDRHHRIDAILFCGHHVLAHFVQHRFGTFGRRIRRQLHQDKERSLIFLGQKSGRQTQEQESQQAQQQTIDQKRASVLEDDTRHALFITPGKLLEGGVEPDKKAVPVLMAVFARHPLLDQGGAQGRGENQGDEYREHHRGGDGNGKLAIDDPG